MLSQGLWHAMFSAYHAPYPGTYMNDSILSFTLDLHSEATCLKTFSKAELPFTHNAPLSTFNLH